MKKILSATSIIAVLTIVSCSKEKTIAPAPPQKSDETSNKKVMAYGYRMAWKFDPWRMTCLPVSENCHPEDIIIRPHHYNDKIYDLFEVATAKVDADIQEYLNENKTDLIDVIPETWIDAGISGTYIVRYFYSRDNNTHFLLFQTAEHIIMAFPMVEKA